MRKQGLARLGGLVTMVAGLGACSPEGSLSAGSARVDPAAESRLRAHFPGQAARVLEGRGFVADGAGFVLDHAEGSTWTPATPELRAELPKAGDEALRLDVGTFEARVREMGAAGEGALVAKAVAYRRAGGTAFWTAAPAGVEEWLHLDAGQGSTGDAVAAWEIESEGGSLRESGSGIEVVDAAGVARIRVTAPAAFAAGGRAVGVALRVRGGRIELTVEASGEELLVDPVWVAAGMMSAGRSQHTATLLGNGDVLVAGGIGTGSPLASAELYDPAANTWAAAAPMSNAREYFTATLLASKKVLVAGGTASCPTGAELYDAVASTWTSGGLMKVCRLNHTATLLKNGKVLVVGGTDPNGVASSAELYDPALNAWVAVAPMGTARYGHTATLLGDGRVLVAGGVSGASQVASVELYDPLADTWSSALPMISSRVDHTATLLKNGMVLVTGGYIDSSISRPSAEIYDPLAAMWMSAGSMSVGRDVHTATILGNGDVLVVGGLNGASSVATSDLYDPIAKSWAPGGPMNVARAFHGATLLDSGKVLATGGDNNGVYLASAEVFLIRPGSPCSTSADCQSGFCADGVCCTTACDAGACDACAKAAGAPTDGTCALLTGPACDDGDACTTPDTCQAGQCKGTQIDCSTSSSSASASSSSTGGAGGAGGASSSAATGTGGTDVTTTTTGAGGGSPQDTPASSNFYTCSATPGLPTNTPSSLLPLVTLALLSARRKSLKIKART